MAGNAVVRVAIVGDNSSLQRALGQSQSMLGRFGKMAGKIGGIVGIGVGAGLAALTKSAIDTEAEFSRTMNTLAAVTGTPAEAMKQLDDLAMQLGASTSFSANEAAEAMLELGKAGIDAQTIMSGAADGTLLLASAAGTDLTTAATIAANAMNTFALQGEDMGRIASTLAGGANASTASIESLGLALQQVGPGAKNAGLNLNETVAVLSAFDNAGIKGSDAGTSLKTMLTRLVPSTEKAGKAMREAGLSFVDNKGNIDDIATVAQKLHDTLGPLSQAERIAALNTMFGSDATRAATVLMNEGRKGVEKYVKATKDRGAAEEAADARMRGTAGALERISGMWETLQLQIGKKLAPVIQDLADYLEANQDKFSDWIDKGAEAAAQAGRLGQAIGTSLWPWLKKLGEIIGDLVGWFNGLSDGTKRTAVQVGVAVLAFGKLLPVLKTVSASLLIMRARVKQVGAEMTYAETRAGLMGTAMGKLAGVAKVAAGAAGMALLVDSFQRTEGAARTLESTLGGAAVGFSVGGPLGAGIGAFAALLVDLKTQLGDTSDAIEALNKETNIATLTAEIDATQRKLDELKGHDDFSFVEDVLGLDPGWLQRTTGEVSGSTKALEEALSSAKSRLADLKSGNDDAARSAAALATATYDESDALRDALGAMRDKRNEANRGLDAELNYQAAIDDANAALKENGRTVDKTTEKGRANLSALNALAAAWNNQSDAAKNAKGSLKQARQGFIDTATQMGLSEAAAKRLADRLFEIPSKRTTKIQLDGVDLAIDKVHSLKAIMDQTKSKDIYINLHYQTLGNRRGQNPEISGAGRVGAGAGAVGSALAPSAGDGTKSGMYGQILGDAWGRGAVEGAGKHKPKLLDELFGDLTKGLEPIEAGLEKIGNLIDRTTHKRIQNDQKAEKYATRLNNALRERYKRLRDVGRQQDANTEALQNATDAVNTYRDSIVSSFTSFGDITQLGQDDEGAVSLDRILAQLRERATQAAEFNRLVQQLQGQGLSQAAVEQLAAAGPDALAVAQQIAAGGAGAIQEISTLTTQIGQAGSALGTMLADKYAIAGQQSALAYITQLEAEQARLNKTAENMATALVNKLTKELAKVPVIKEPKKKDGKDGGAKQGRQPDTDAATGKNDRTNISVRLTGAQTSALDRGRSIQVDLDAYHAAGGRRRATTGRR